MESEGGQAKVSSSELLRTAVSFVRSVAGAKSKTPSGDSNDRPTDNRPPPPLIRTRVDPDRVEETQIMASNGRIMV